MTTFNARRQAEEIVRPRLRLGKRKPQDKEARRGWIYSTQTATTYRHHLTKLARWAKTHYRCRLVQITPAIAQKYLRRARPPSDAQDPQPGPALPRDAAQDRAGRPGAAAIHRSAPDA